MSAEDRFNATLRNQVYLEGLKRRTAKDLQSSLKLTEAEAKKVLDALATKPLDKMTRTELEALRGELRKVFYRSAASILTDLGDSLRGVAEYQSDFEKKLFDEYTTIKAKQISGAVVYEDVLEAPLQGAIEHLQKYREGKATRDTVKTIELINGFGPAQVKGINAIVSRGFVEGWTNQDIFKAIRGTKEMNYADGLMKHIGNNIDCVAHTSVQYIAGQVRYRTWEKNSDVIEGYRFIATLDDRTTPICKALDRQVFQLGKGPFPPVHARCRSTTIAELGPEYDFLDEGATRSAQFGPVSAELTYYEWLGQQSPGFQDSALGKVRAKLFRDGGISPERFAKMTVDEKFQPLTLDEMRKLEPEVFRKAGI